VPVATDDTVLRWTRALDAFEASLDAWAALPAGDETTAAGDTGPDDLFAGLGPPPRGVRARAHDLPRRSLEVTSTLVLARDAVGVDLARTHRPAHIYDQQQTPHLLDRRG
jgi:hypothetical protein